MQTEAQNKTHKTTRALVLALLLVSITGLAACSTTSSSTSSNTSSNGESYIRRAERIADQLPRGGGL